MITGGPSPLHGVTGLDRNGAGIKVVAALSDGDIRRRRESGDGKEEDEESEQPEMHSGELFQRHFRPGG